MATHGSFQPDRPPPAIPEDRPTPPDERPSDDSSTIHNRAAAGPLGNPQLGSTRARRDRKPSNAGSAAMGEVGPPRLDFDWERDEPPPPSAGPPQRNPSRQGQVMRWGPPPTPSSDYGGGWDDERRYWPRPPYDYGKPVAPPGPYRDDWYGDDPYYNRPYRRPSTIRESAEWGGSYRRGGPGGPPRPPRRPRYHPHWEDPSEDGESDEQPLRRVKRKRTMRSNPSSRSPPPEVIMRLPFTEWMNRSAKAHFVATMGEFMGTTMFLFFAFAGTQVANIGAGDSSNQSTTNASTGFSPIVLLYVALSFGFSLMVNVWIFFRISGGLFNPAVTVAMVMVKGVSVVRGVLLIGAQLVGAIFSSFIVSVLFPTTFNVRTTLSPDTSVARGVFIEALLTAELVFTIYMLANEKHKATFMAPVGIGMALFIAEMVGVYYTGGSLNPARSFGPCVISGVWDPEHWIYWVGPVGGAVLAWAFYKFIKMLEYEMANPGQESSSQEEADQEAAELTPQKKETV
ncbi:hypothetical protein M409DRAFT_26703 [Zasmidium cellare ATCC 36951]|uniref:Aquaporin n=1 Tax=Zasmidium cellare ATCC 36951 TaxID=1080233 RepID=A0A6A6C6P3_ZASCE|nr:uncharacterized protein M409DRAFT_26703 [Zasmidium cellare ATCC 36951]KAF2162847.1 hypothetical protein M409DRAFT_26703 [Zasmidium cellare ATCC 36951]